MHGGLSRRLFPAHGSLETEVALATGGTVNCAVC
jgi:hypothetical protein